MQSKYRRKPGRHYSKIVREIRKNRGFESGLRGCKWSEEDKTSSKSLKREIRTFKKTAVKSLNLVLHRNRTGIVAKNKYDVAARDVQTHVQIVPHSKPGEAPFTNPEKGSPLRKGIYYKDFPEGFQLYAVSRDGDKVYTNLEHGGTVLGGAKKGGFIGYTLVHTYEESSFTHHKFSHKRVSLQRRFSGKKEQIRFEPRPFFEPAKKRAVEKIQDIFGAEAAQYADKVRFF